MESPEKILLNVIVNGHPVPVEGNVDAPLRTVVEHALEKSGNSGQPVENWELRDATGQVFDLSRKIGEFNFPAGTNLFLNLKAGVGG
jgi:hypothetical protein